MKFLKNLFGGLNLDVNKLVDNVVTTDAERKELKIKFKELILNAQANAEEQITRRWESDNQAGWLPANIRPLTLAFLVVSTVLLIFIEGGVIDFNVKDNWIDLLQLVLITVIGAYFGGRSFEKVKKT
ncbi:MAG: hypothetical protein GOVbin7581_49 [Prokaryotic dsDNA virus sp.]|jgi:hypothetical protein|nr:MAG: hypothetical protein GOVbin7581_49 [Prokaryotic dsDNA virus sp.]QDP63638.1 MAG: hypothetical protein Unbinned3987contig1001_14 [Prokaryotic dsDNA virus sp.]|tara:strand:+ start:23538 stop:23918 length:381 start_codon:yes stop_codon:yes gene_type:complete